MANKLEHYLRTYRKRVGFTQKELAFLLGSKSSAKVSRYERYRRQPSLEAAFALQIIFHARTPDLFGGIHHRVEGLLLRRAKLLLTKLLANQKHPRTARKQAHLRALCERILKNADARR